MFQPELLGLSAGPFASDVASASPASYIWILPHVYIYIYAAKNKNRMFVNGKYIPSSHPLHKPGRYRSLDDAWSHNKIESVSEGEVYAIGNKAWPEWIKIGKAVDAEDRLNGYQTSSPFRDYFIITKVATKNRHDAERKMHRLFEEKAEERSNEWFKISQSKLMELFDGFRAAS